MSSLLELIQCGQSYWMDNLSRAMIQSGALNKRIVEDGLRGITSNPTIFDKAISKRSDYDAQIARLPRHTPAKNVYEELAVKDIQDACDLLRATYDQTQGTDGFVSLEVSPYLAHDTEATMAEARRLFKKVDRPNVFIKIPGTAAGVPAIEEMLYEGVNINITLLFSVERYEQVAKTYLTALERRLAKGGQIDNIASVASFFLSRIDVLVDQLLQHRMSSKDAPAGALIGKVAIANAKLAYHTFKKLVSTERWRKLEAKGARVQRPLWASTSTKNPRYSDVYYVEPLIGSNTVNTMPEETIAAFADHGRATRDTIEQGLAEAAQTMGDLEKLGIDFRCVAWQLENEGVQKFIDAFAELNKTIEIKHQRLVGS